MKKLLATSLLLALAACGSKEKEKTSDPVIDNRSQRQVTIPAGATRSTYSCEEKSEFLQGNSGARGTQTLTYSGKVWSWVEQDQSGNRELDIDVDYNEDDNLLDRTLSRSRTVKLKENEYRVYTDDAFWSFENNAWQKSGQTTERIFQIGEDKVRRTILYRVNGELKPYSWDSSVTKIDDRTTQTVRHHTNPGSRNRDGRTYLAITLTCTDIQL